MNKMDAKFKDPDFQKADVALRRAAVAARRLSRQTKTPFIVYQDGRIVDLNAPKPRKVKPSTTA